MSKKSKNTIASFFLIASLKTLVIAFSTFVILVSSFLWYIGFWTTNSPRYWRSSTQTTLLYVSHESPKFLVPSLTRLALKIHTDGVSYEETKKAAKLFESADENKSASKLWFSLVKPDIDSKRIESAIHHAFLSQKANTNEDALVALTTLNAKNAENRAIWVSELEKNYPNNELVQVFNCVKRIKSFGNSLPSFCRNVAWVLQKAESGKVEYSKITKKIIDLPNEAERNIKKHEGSIRERLKENGKYQIDINNLQSKKDSVLLQQFGNWIWRLLPLPLPGDTFMSYIVREGICSLPIVRWVCRLIDTSTVVSNVKREWKELNEHKDNLLTLIRLNKELNGYDREKIAYWNSPKPLEELTQARNKILPAFQGEVEESILNRKESLGITTIEAVTSIV